LRLIAKSGKYKTAGGFGGFLAGGFAGDLPVKFCSKFNSKTVKKIITS
jgi:hypothetical protein